MDYSRILHHLLLILVASTSFQAYCIEISCAGAQDRAPWMIRGFPLEGAFVIEVPGTQGHIYTPVFVVLAQCSASGVL